MVLGLLHLCLVFLVFRLLLAHQIISYYLACLVLQRSPLLSIGVAVDAILRLVWVATERATAGRVSHLPVRHIALRLGILNVRMSLLELLHLPHLSLRRGQVAHQSILVIEAHQLYAAPRLLLAYILFHNILIYHILPITCRRGRSLIARLRERPRVI